DGHFAPHSVQLGEVFAHTTSEVRGVELGFDGDATGDQVQSAREAQDRRQLGGTNRCFWDVNASEFVFDVGGECQSWFHSVVLPGPMCARGDDYSRPRSRCLTLTATPGCFASREASSLAMATERC